MNKYFIWYYIAVARYITVIAQSNVNDDVLSCSSDIVYLNASTTQQTLTSPSYPSTYPNNEYCRWIVSSSSTNYVIRINLETIRILSDFICKQDYLLIQDGSGLYAPIVRTCCQDACPDNSTITSTENSLRITFKSDNLRTDAGFVLKYWTVPKSSKEVKDATYSAVNYVLFVIFGITMCSIILTLLLILVCGNRNYKTSLHSKLFAANTAEKYTTLKSQPHSNESVKSLKD